MRAHTTTNMSRRRRKARRRHALALALGVSALAMPASAHAGGPSALDDGGEEAIQPGTGVDNATANSITGAASDVLHTGGSTESVGGSDYSSVNATTGPASEQSGSGYSSVNATTGPSPGQPTIIAESPGRTADGFDWGSAAVGAGAAMALAAFCGAALLTVRRRTALSHTPAAG